jgi:hypothetical protein
MNADFLKSGWGRGLLAVLACLFIFLSWRGCQTAQQAAHLPTATNAAALAVIDRSSSLPAPLPPHAPVTNAPKSTVILTLDADLPTDTNEISTVFARAGCSLKCVLVNSLESIRIDTPVIGLVIEDLSFNGNVVVPRHTKIFGKTQVDRVRDRLAADGQWTLVFPTGDELVVPGQALHCDVSADGRHHGPDDGTAGLKGKVLNSTTTWDELKFFASSFLGAMARSQQQTDNSFYGPQLRRGLQNGVSAGTAAVLDEYARSIADTIKRDGIYVHVDGGSMFYVFLPQTLDRGAVRVGASRHRNSNQP